MPHLVFPPRPPRRLLALAACGLLSIAHAVDDTQTGADGAPGTPGTNNNANTPGTAGGAGGNGADAAANAVSGDATNRATATGGRGGIGGDGGFGSVGANAGAGGNGGAASATATTNNSNASPAAPFVTEATARGGAGGNGGRGGFGATNSNGDGGDGGIGAAAVATAMMTGTLGPAIPGTMWNEIIATATGGQGGNGHSRGGVPGVGGDSGPGGAAMATARGDGVTGQGHLRVVATQTGGGAGFASSGGQAANGADSVMLDAVSGTTLFPWQLELRQIAIAGGAGSAGTPASGNFIEEILTMSGLAGNASSRLTAHNPGGGLLSATVSATGGRGGDNETGLNGGGSGPLTDSGDATDGGTATAGATLTGDRSVTGFVTARGGDGGVAQHRGALGLGGHGGAAILAPIFGQTTLPGSVSITAEAAGGGGGGSERGIAGDGAAVNLLNALDGDPGATGQLLLIQRAVGGVGGFSFDGTLGQAGTATSTLNQTKALTAFRSDAVAIGGTGAERKFTSGTAGVGATATASNTARNTTGSLDLRATATGGRGGHGNNNIPGEPALSTPSAVGGAGGAAYSFADGTTDIAPLTIDSRATGGEAGRVLWGRAAAPAQDGGAAESTASGTALGSAPAHVASTAVGGAGGGTGLASPGAGGGGGDGGSATATGTVTAGAGGNGRVNASASGGSGGSTSAENQRGGDGGAAAATASGASTSGASLDVYAVVRGGSGGLGFSGGDGMNATLHNAVSASTSGPIYLSQTALGGHGGAAFGPGTPGLAGAAASHLSVVDPASSFFSGRSVAEGGAGGWIFDGAVAAANGANAIASLDLTGIGDVLVEAEAVGGAGGFAENSNGGAPGLASLGAVRGVSTGAGAVTVLGRAVGGKGGGSGAATAMPGQAITLHDAVTGTTIGALSLEQVAVGGEGGNFNGIAPGLGALGGAASSTLTRSANVPALTLVATGIGGTGGSTALGSVGAGGAAVATATGTNTQSGGFLSVDARADGGLPGQRYDIALDAPSGAATATATGTASGSEAIANIHAAAASLRRASDSGGGDGGPTLASTLGDTAHAVATGTGPEGSVAARAQSYAAAAFDLVTTADVNLLNTSSAESRVGVAEAAVGLTGDRQVFALATALPLASDIDAAVLGNPDATVAFTLGNPDVLALGLLGGAFAESAAGAPLVSVAALSLSIETSLLTDPRRLLVGFVNPEITGAGFDLLHFTLQVEDSLLLDVSFTDTAAALAYFEDRVFDFGAIHPWTPPDLEVPTLDVLARFEITTSGVGDGFSTETLVANSAVPEPASALLLALGGAAFALRRRRP